MTLSAGAVTIDGVGSRTGGGLAVELYDIIADTFSLDTVLPPSAPGAQIRIANIANSIAVAVVGHITNNAVVTVAAGIAVSTTGTPLVHTGQTDAEGIGTIA